VGLSIRNREVERLARSLAKHRGVSMTEAIRQALAHELSQEDVRPELHEESRLQRMLEIARSAASLPIVDDRSEDEILGYDDHGIPTR
jgi:antitoxin VapB